MGVIEPVEPKLFVPRGQFQTEGTKFILEHSRAQLNVDMGLGKTIITLNALDLLFTLGDGPALILAPLRVARGVWPNEVTKWRHLQHLTVSPIVGTAEQRKAAIRREVPIYTVNYENLQWLVEQHKGSWPYKIVVADESTKLSGCRSSIQINAKGTRFISTGGGARTSALSKVAFHHVDRWINLTGTFAPNGLEKTWGQLWFLDGGKRLGNTFTAFKERWFRIGFNGYGMEALPYAEEQIRTSISDICFTLDANDYLALPKEIVNNIYVDLPAEQMLQYKKMEKEFFIQIRAGEVEAFTAAVKSAKCHQIANGAIYYDKEGRWEGLHEAKVDALQSIVEEMGGEPVIVVYKFKSDLIRLQKAFPQGKKFDQHSQTQIDFMAGRIPLLFLHPGSAGHGVDGLQVACNTMVFFSLDWNVEERLQTIARIGAVRQFQAGFDRPVKIHQLVARNTVDEDILDRVESKITVEQALKRGMARRGLV